ncbi:MAG TPA: SCP2 sterol-binding domain-containing protein [Rubricoccaceae bacterium]|nr:SCP2 sterol-binding domain-containing protein [Rubricoccaceae bacterium]
MPRYASLDEVLASYPSRFRADKAEGVDATVLMHLTGANARDVLLRVRDGQLAIEDGATAPDPTLTLTADADDWLAVENGQLNPMLAMMQGKLKLRGSLPFATKFMSLFGYGG